MKSGFIEASGRKIPYKIIRRKGMRRMTLSFSSKGELVLSAPRLAPSILIHSFLKKSRTWVDANQRHIAKRSERAIMGRSEYEERREEAREIIDSRVRELAQSYGFRYVKISIRNQRTRFGSCSRSGNLSFHYKVAFFAPEERDYIIIHELCHLRHFNHSADFWDEVGKYVPEYERIRKTVQLRSHDEYIVI